ncbi:T-cell receptor alpha chain V region RL-5 [Anabarilius grahami]|nr:T-cell receptor alpha chain V region RL-5 [Anabarilius grahami]
MILFYLTIGALLTESVFANAITPLSTVNHAVEGEKTTLSCNYSGNDIRSLQWYRQHPNTAPEFLLQAFENQGPVKNSHHVTEAQKDKKQLNLEISKTEISDSAIYYCALVPTVTGNPSTLYKNLR